MEIIKSNQIMVRVLLVLLFFCFNNVILMIEGHTAVNLTTAGAGGLQLGDHAPPMLTYLTAAVKQGAGGALQLGDHAPPMLTYLTAAVKQGAGGLGEGQLTYLTDAIKEGAVCLDGSPPAYQLERGVGQGVDKWIVYLQGGGLCHDTTGCLHRSITRLGSSYKMAPLKLTGVLSNNHRLNPYFYNWNRVLVRYCDGGLYTGNNYDPVHKLHYKGAKIFDFVVKTLLDRGLKNATNVLLHGCSAGGQGAILNCDKFRSFLPAHINVKCASDAGYFVHVKDLLGEYNFVKSFMEGCAKLHGSIPNLPKACTSAMKPKYLCLYPQYVIPHIKTPVFIINSALDRVQILFVFLPSIERLPPSWKRCREDFGNCSRDQLEILKRFRLHFLHALPQVGNGTFRGMYITSCTLHCRDHLEPTQRWTPKMRYEQNELIKALGNWTVAGSPYQKIDKIDKPQVCVR